MAALLTEIIETRRLSWYAIQVRARQEKVVSQLLEYRGYEHFLPVKTRKDRETARNRDPVLFPGYLFCRLNLSDRTAPVVTIPGVIRLVGFGERPVAVPDEEISSLQTIVKSTLPAEAASVFQTGRKVRIVAGPLQGVEGVLDSMKPRHRIIVRITLLQRAISVEVDDRMVVPCDGADDYSSVLAAAPHSAVNAGTPRELSHLGGAL